MTQVSDRNAGEILSTIGIRDAQNRKQGLWRVFTRDPESGLSLVSTKVYENDVQSGVEEHYDRDGNVILRVEYKDGKPLNPLSELVGDYGGNKQDMVGPAARPAGPNGPALKNG